jgi:benzodiazapine receptor
MAAMTVTSRRPVHADLVRSILVVMLAVLQIVVSGLAQSGFTHASIGAVAREYATPLLAAGWAFAIWAPIYVGFLGYAVYQALPAQRGRQLHREIGWWLAFSAVLNAGWVLAFGAGWVPLAELLIVLLLVALAVVFGRLSRQPAESVLERVVLRGTVALYTGWVSFAIALGTAATGVWMGLPGTGVLAAIAAVVVLLAVSVIASWVVLAGTAVIGYSIAAVWAAAGIALNDPPAAVVVAGAIAIVVIIASTTRRLTTAGNPMRAAWG